MLASMSATEWSELAVSELPTGTVTLLLADVEGSTRLWETQPEQMRAAIARLDDTLAELIAIHGGVRPVEQGEGDSFVLAFARASDAVACALALQRAPLAPIRLRIGVNTGEIQLRDEGNYIGPTINRTARLRDLAHGGQTVLSGATESMVLDHLPADAWLNDLGSHALRDLPRPERVVQLCHPDIPNEFPPLRTPKVAVVQRFPTQLTSFVGREEQMSEVRGILAGNRLVTLTGAGGAGKTRMAIQVGGQIRGDFRDGAWYADLAPIADADSVPITVARALGLPDQPGRSTVDTILRFIGDREMLLVLDNCEHLLDASSELSITLLDRCPGLTLLTTSREPIGLAGEVVWRVPSLSLADEAVELFGDRARLARPDFRLTDDNVGSVTEICRRLDGMPLAIELAAARVRALSLAEILDSLHDRFRLLTGGSRTAVRRQQTLRASVEWSHALLTEPERVLFRRLAVFMGGFDLDAAQAVSGDRDVERYQVLDLLTLLVDKSLVVAEDNAGRMRYRLLETVRQYALEKLAESGEADEVRTRHRDHYTGIAIEFDSTARVGEDQLLERAESDMDNMRAAFAWNRERCDTDGALRLASALSPLWLAHGCIQEALTWFDAAADDEMRHRSEISPAVRVRAVVDRALLDMWAGFLGRVDEVDQALAIARELGDPVLLARALVARGIVVGFDEDVARPYFTEASDLARAVGDEWRLTQMLAWRGYVATVAGDPIAARAASEEGRRIADAIGDRFSSRVCRGWRSWAYLGTGELQTAAAQLREVLAEAEEAHDLNSQFSSLHALILVMAYQGDELGCRAVAEAALDLAPELGGFYPGVCQGAIAAASLAVADVATAANAGATAREQLTVSHPEVGALWLYPMAEVSMASGDLLEARRWADEAVSMTRGWHLSLALLTRARVAIAEKDLGSAERDVHEALRCAAEVEGHLVVPDLLECLARIVGADGSHREAARLLGAADTIRQRFGAVRFGIYEGDHQRCVAEVRDALGVEEFEASWAEGVVLSIQEAIAYAQRGRGERKRPSSGWASLTPTELDVVRLVREGLGNKDIAARLFVSHRTVQTHLTHVYTKLGLTSRVQLAQEAARRA